LVFGQSTTCLSSCHTVLKCLLKSLCIAHETLLQRERRRRHTAVRKAHLGNEEHGGGFVQSSAIAVDVGSKGNDESDNAGAAFEINSTLHSHRHGGCRRGGTESQGKGREVAPVLQTLVSPFLPGMQVDIPLSPRTVQM
jgi:hypothetical protein